MDFVKSWMADHCRICILEDNAQQALGEITRFLQARQSEDRQTCLGFDFIVQCFSIIIPAPHMQSVSICSQKLRSRVTMVTIQTISRRDDACSVPHLCLCDTCVP